MGEEEASLGRLKVLEERNVVLETRATEEEASLGLLKVFEERNVVLETRATEEEALLGLLKAMEERNIVLETRATEAEERAAAVVHMEARLEHFARFEKRALEAEEQLRTLGTSGPPTTWLRPGSRIAPDE